MPREKWDRWSEFLFSNIGMAVGLGNIWRFPYICYTNGGGAFLIPYCTFLILLGIPVMFTEMSLAQFCNLGPGKFWDCCPMFRGIGIGMILMTALIAIYYNVILSWALYYVFSSFYDPLPWKSQENKLNVSSCTNRTICESNITADRIRTTEEFWNTNVLDISNGIDNIGTINVHLAICLLIAWIVTFLSLLKGIKTSGKTVSQKVELLSHPERYKFFKLQVEIVVYFAASLPYICFSIIFVKVILLDGAIDGLKAFVTPRFEQIFRLSTWRDAAVQLFFSAGLGWGGISTLASYNDRKNKCWRDTIIILLIDGLTSFFIGSVIYATLGYIAKTKGKAIDDVVSQGPGLVFIVYPEALSSLPVPQFWSLLFFISIFAVGLDSQMVHIQTIICGICDAFPALQPKQTIVTVFVCVSAFFAGLIFITKGGVYILQIFDWYTASISITLLVFAEITVLTWIYGLNQMSLDYMQIFGKEYSKAWRILIKFITPLILLSLWIFNFTQFKAVKYGSYRYPSYVNIIGVCLGLTPIIPIPICFFTTIYGGSGSLTKRVREGLKPRPSWQCNAVDRNISEREMLERQ